MNDKRILQEAADRLHEAETKSAAISPVRGSHGVKDVKAAYGVQEINTRRALSSGRRLVGRKIGLTSEKVQKQLGVDQCDFGMLFGDMAVDENGLVPKGRLIQPKVEAEIAFVLGADLLTPGLTLADIMRSTDFVVPAIEIVDSRICNWDITIVDTIADNASSGCFVLGTDRKSPSRVDYRLCGMVMEVGGEPVSSGAGAACLGNPLNAVRWLAEKMIEIERPLLAGDVVLSGALGPMFAVSLGVAVEARISGLGSVRVNFEGAAQ